MCVELSTGKADFVAYSEDSVAVPAAPAVASAPVAKICSRRYLRPRSSAPKLLLLLLLLLL